MAQSSKAMNTNNDDYYSILHDIELAASGKPYDFNYNICYEYDGNFLLIPKYVRDTIVEHSIKDRNDIFVTKETNYHKFIYDKLYSLFYNLPETNIESIKSIMYDLMKWVDSSRISIRIFISYNGKTTIECRQVYLMKQNFITYVDDISKIIYILTDDKPLKIRLFKNC